MSKESTQFKRTPDGEKTPLMREIEQRIGRTLEDDFREFHLINLGRKGYGKPSLAKRWGVTRGQIWGPLGPGRQTWAEILKLPDKDNTSAKERSLHVSRRCEICSTDDVALERAHWIPR